jgi:hypothetical protein
VFGPPTIAKRIKKGPWKGALKILSNVSNGILHQQMGKYIDQFL